MSYSRFSEGDVYMFLTGGRNDRMHVLCQSCRLAPKEPSLFTKGVAPGKHPIYKDGIAPCRECGGQGCDGCMMHGDTVLKTFSEAIAHLLEHKSAGHNFSEDAIQYLKKDRDQYTDNMVDNDA